MHTGPHGVIAREPSAACAEGIVFIPLVLFGILRSVLTVVTLKIIPKLRSRVLDIEETVTWALFWVGHLLAAAIGWLPYLLPGGK